MNDIIAMHRADLVDAVTVAVRPLKARIGELEAAIALALQYFEKFQAGNAKQVLLTVSNPEAKS